MSFEFKGTFNRSQFERLRTFLAGQLQDVTGRIQHLQYEAERVGQLFFKYDSEGILQGWEVQPGDSYLDRLLKAYEVAGGDVLYDLNCRVREDPVFRRRGTEVDESQLMSNGEIIGVPGLADALTGGFVQALRDPHTDVVRWRRDYLERKIRRMLDYYDQIQTEIQDLTASLGDATTNGSFLWWVESVNIFIDDPEYRACYDDAGSDPHGKLVYAPFSAYDVGPERGPARSTQRQTGGVVKRGETG
jgi:hypothetical protein